MAQGISEYYIYDNLILKAGSFRANVSLDANLSLDANVTKFHFSKKTKHGS